MPVDDMALPDRFDVAVIGAGLIGSAAARHLGESGKRVALIGPSEPTTYDDPAVPLASHYDEARITRISASDPVWAELAARSIGRYSDIAARTGINFHKPTGLVQVSLDAPSAIVSASARGGEAYGVDRQWLRDTFAIEIPDDAEQELLYEAAPAGVISPRRLVGAQQALTMASGGLIFDAPATHFRRAGTDFEVAVGVHTVRASQLLIATGAYGASLVGVDLAIERRLRTVVTAELASTAPLPCLIIERPQHDGIDRLYWTPPVRYPDGRMLLKIGGSLPFQTADSDDDIAAWFRSGGSQGDGLRLVAALQALLPDTQIMSWEHKPCVMTYTPSELPFIGTIDSNVVAALGGNGSAAKSSDEIGRLAAQSLGGWHDSVLDAATFTPSVLA